MMGIGYTLRTTQFAAAKQYPTTSSLVFLEFRDSSEYTRISVSFNLLTNHVFVRSPKFPVSSQFLSAQKTSGHLAYKPDMTPLPMTQKLHRCAKTHHFHLANQSVSISKRFQKYVKRKLATHLPISSIHATTQFIMFPIIHG